MAPQITYTWDNVTYRAAAKNQGVYTMAVRIARATGLDVIIENAGGTTMVGTIDAQNGTTHTFTAEGWAVYASRADWEHGYDATDNGSGTPLETVLTVTDLIGKAARPVAEQRTVDAIATLAYDLLASLPTGSAFNLDTSPEGFSYRVRIAPAFGAEPTVKAVVTVGRWSLPVIIVSDLDGSRDHSFHHADFRDTLAEALVVIAARLALATV